MDTRVAFGDIRSGALRDSLCQSPQTCPHLLPCRRDSRPVFTHQHRLNHGDLCDIDALASGVHGLRQWIASVNPSSPSQTQSREPFGLGLESGKVLTVSNPAERKTPRTRTRVHFRRQIQTPLLLLFFSTVPVIVATSMTIGVWISLNSAIMVVCVEPNRGQCDLVLFVDGGTGVDCCSGF